MREYRTLSSRGGRRELRPWHLALTGVVCLLVGIVIGSRAGGGDDDGGGGGAAGADDELTVLDSVVSGVDLQTTTTAALLPPTQVLVVVLNGAGIEGEAGRQSEELAALGYRMLDPDNTETATQTAVYFTPEFQDECQVLADTVADQRSEAVQNLALVDTITTDADCTVVVAAPGLSPTTTAGGTGATSSSTPGSSTPGSSTGSSTPTTGVPATPSG